MDEPDEQAASAVGGRRRAELRSWLLFDADRRLVAGIVLFAVSAPLVVLGALDPAPLHQAVRSSDPIETLFQALVAAIITGVALVVTINQLVLSQELGALGDQRERMQGAMSFRRDVEAVLDLPVSPAEPSAFLRALLLAARDRAKGLRTAVGDGADETVRARTDVFVDELAGNALVVADRLDGAAFGSFAVVSAALEFDYSRQIHDARRLRAALGDDHRDAASAVDDLLEVLEFYGSTREHVKTLYFQWSLIDLSRTILYVSVPALVVAVGTVLFLDDPGTVTGSTAGVDNLLWVVIGSVTVSLVPYAVLLAYVLRIATLAKRTLAIGPFVLQDAEDGGDRR